MRFKIIIIILLNFMSFWAFGAKRFEIASMKIFNMNNQGQLEEITAQNLNPANSTPATTCPLVQSILAQPTLLTQQIQKSLENSLNNPSIVLPKIDLSAFFKKSSAPFEILNLNTPVLPNIIQPLIPTQSETKRTSESAKNETIVHPKEIETEQKINKEPTVSSASAQIESKENSEKLIVQDSFKNDTNKRKPPTNEILNDTSKKQRIDTPKSSTATISIPLISETPAKDNGSTLSDEESKKLDEQINNLLQNESHEQLSQSNFLPGTLYVDTSITEPLKHTDSINLTPTTPNSEIIALIDQALPFVGDLSAIEVNPENIQIQTDNITNNSLSLTPTGSPDAVPINDLEASPFAYALPLNEEEINTTDAIPALPEIGTQNAQSSTTTLSDQKESKEKKENDENLQEEDLDQTQMPKNHLRKIERKKREQQKTKRSRALFNILKNLPKDQESKKYKEQLIQIEQYLKDGIYYGQTSEIGGVKLTIEKFCQRHPKILELINKYKYNQDQVITFEKYAVTENKEKNSKRLVSLLYRLRSLHGAQFETALKLIKKLLKSKIYLNLKSCIPTKDKVNATELFNEYIESDPEKYKDLKKIFDEYHSAKSYNKTTNAQKTGVHPSKKTKKTSDTTTIMRTTSQDHSTVINASNCAPLVPLDLNSIQLPTVPVQNSEELNAMNFVDFDPTSLYDSSSIIPLETSSNASDNIQPVELRPTNSLDALETEALRPVSSFDGIGPVETGSINSLDYLLALSLDDSSASVSNTRLMQVELAPNVIAYVDQVNDNVIKIEGLAKEVVELKGHASTIHALKKLDNCRLISYCVGELRLWNLVTGENRIKKTSIVPPVTIDMLPSGMINLNGNFSGSEADQMFEIDEFRVDTTNPGNASNSSSSSSAQAMRLAALSITNRLTQE